MLNGLNNFDVNDDVFNRHTARMKLLVNIAVELCILSD